VRDGSIHHRVVLLPIDLLAREIAGLEASGRQRLGEVSGRLTPCALRCIAHNKPLPLHRNVGAASAIDVCRFDRIGQIEGAGAR
jgi:hypothetical protein